ncbi:hypothetical protein CYMTET_47345 [Cymbomonas tetramitiformis]|uniref:Uncharacterized protein n=1 Tax=Cymbomonas tetramitiformis TaxID=36881 RepID=A0AAE0BVX3_9CHLO|nr:hypothetical protein CYMTET_47345 [Cymbomonas tetramitiformis]
MASAETLEDLKLPFLIREWVILPVDAASFDFGASGDDDTALFFDAFDVKPRVARIEVDSRCAGDGEIITRIREFLEVMGKHAVFFRACLKEVSARWFGALVDFYCFVDIAREIVAGLPFETRIRGETPEFLEIA